MTATQTLDQADIAGIQSAVDALTEAIALLDRVGKTLTLPQVARFTQAAAVSADTALIIASNELKLAQRGE